MPFRNHGFKMPSREVQTSASEDDDVRLLGDVAQSLRDDVLGLAAGLPSANRSVLECRRTAAEILTAECVRVAVLGGPRPEMMLTLSQRLLVVGNEVPLLPGYAATPVLAELADRLRGFAEAARVAAIAELDDLRDVLRRIFGPGASVTGV